MQISEKRNVLDSSSILYIVLAFAVRKKEALKLSFISVWGLRSN